MLEQLKKERNFLLLIAVLLIAAAAFTPYPSIAMWFGFALAGYSAIANDSIQTIGTFIVSNQHRKWWVLWLYIGTIFVVTVTYGWIIYDGDVSYERLTTKGFDEAPDSFSFLQLCAPIVLIILTRMRMPVSTTFLLLNAFTTKSGAIGKVLLKSLSGYGIAFLSAIVIWFLVDRLVKISFKGKAHPAWTVVQWISSGTLWSVWIMQDAANIAIFLPRSLDLGQFLGFTIYIFLGLGLLFYMRGDRIQKIVNEKSVISDVRAATIIDLIYAFILIYFKVISSVPMSTTWVFLGLLGGRELSIALRRKTAFKRKRRTKNALRMIGKDILAAAIGLIVSLILAVAINPVMREEFINLF